MPETITPEQAKERLLILLDQHTVALREFRDSLIACKSTTDQQSYLKLLKIAEATIPLSRSVTTCTAEVQRIALLRVTLKT